MMGVIYDSLNLGYVSTLPGEPHGQKGLVGYSPWGCKELDMTERLTLSLSHFEHFYNEQWEYFMADDGHN